MYSFKSTVRYSETGLDRRLTIPMLLNYFQDCSTMQSEDLGIGIEYLTPKSMAWVLNFWQVDILRRPMLGEKIVISTWPYDFKGAMGHRNYLMETETGEKLAYANTLYTLLHMEKHIPVKPDEKMIEAYKLEEKFPMEYLSRKLFFEGEGEAKEPVTVQRHHIDTNDHVNNVQYVDMACDLIPRSSKVKRILASYHISAVLSDTIYPVVHQMGNEVGVELNREDGKSFCKIKLCMDEG